MSVFTLHDFGSLVESASARSHAAASRRTVGGLGGWPRNCDPDHIVLVTRSTESVLSLLYAASIGAKTPHDARAEPAVA